MAPSFEITREMVDAVRIALSPSLRNKQPEKFWSDLSYDMKRILDFLKDYRPQLPKFYGRSADTWEVRDWQGRILRTLIASELLAEDIFNKAVDWHPSTVTVNSEDATFLWPSSTIGGGLYRVETGEDVDDVIRATLFDGAPHRRPRRPTAVDPATQPRPSDEVIF